eukprot:12406045-Karenia_brevis.AAC.1
MTENDDHPRNSILSVANFLPTNQCIFCESVLKSKASAVQHMRFALKRGYCQPDKGFFVHPVDMYEGVTT